MKARPRSMVREEKARSFSPSRRLSAFIVGLLVLLFLKGLFSRGNNGFLADPNAKYMQLVEPPDLTVRKAENKRRTLYIFPGKENKCQYQYDYTCKFWFYIRCYVYGAFPNIKMLNSGPSAISGFKKKAKDGDIALVIWRSKNHTIVPEALRELIRWRDDIYEHPIVPNRGKPRVRIGVFHIANENNRTDWPWYSMPDFIVRNYWIPNMPLHATYIPLGPQLPNDCTPRSTESGRLQWQRRPQPICSCNGLGYVEASKRKYMWNFSGSLRKKRAELLRRLRQTDSLKRRGYVQVSKKFGGDGEFGTISKNPKNSYLESILHSQFVFAPCGNAMETHRIYEAVALGAIPVVENCDPPVSKFFPFPELLIDGGPKEMVNFVRNYVDKPGEVDFLQKRVTAWWRTYSEQFANDVAVTVNRHVPPVWKENP